MRRSVAIIIGICSVLVIVCVAATILALQLIRRSFPTVDGYEHVTSINQRIKIARDTYGVPHIEAGTEYDGFFAVGYVHAQDRLWQMELQRRAGMGRLSEVLGKDALGIDKMFKTLGFARIARELESVLDSSTRNALQAYTNGVNEYIRTHKGKYPLEFDILRYEPEPWSLQHSLIMSRLMAWELNYARWVDLTCAALVARVGYDMASEAFPYWEPTAPFILQQHKLSNATISQLKSFFDGDVRYRSLWGGVSIAVGSNAWVIAGSKSTTGKPILANDPHLLLMVPARWYELHLTTPHLDVAGMTIPGVPFVIIGRNRSIAWGVTNAMLDDADFYIEEVDTIPYPRKYRTGTGWAPLIVQEDTIFIKDDVPHVFTILKTERGPIINNYEPGAKFFNELISLRWTGFERTNEPGAFYRLNKATTWSEFTSALQSFGVPAQNFVYADTVGNIGYIMAGAIPLRTYRGVTLPSNGWEAQNQWKGIVSFEHNPRLFNPRDGLIITANNKIVGDEYPYYLSSHWEPPWRSKRIWKCISLEEKISPETVERIQNDVYSLQAEEYVPIILQAFDTVTVHNRSLKLVLEYFRSWNYETRKEDVATTLFEVTHYFLLRNTFADEMGEELFQLYLTLASTPLTAIQRVLGNPQSRWFDDCTTSTIETRDDIVRKSVGDALAFLESKLGGEVKEWQWGRIHTITFNHIFSVHSLLARVFNIGAFEVGGTHSTINVGYYTLTNPFACSVGPSMRQIINLADVNDTRVVLPPGESGQVFHPHYSDQVHLWLNGVYRRRWMDREISTRECIHTLILEPNK
ncbi:MAG: penicillin acylase family protein [Bacteroidetes bacterium]|nr:penicillin acylase family protein [Bacteroidota bacterium]